MKQRFGFVILALSTLLQAANAAPAAAAGNAATGNAAAPLRPADCITDDRSSGISVEFGGKTYYLKSQACKDEFLTDPERYSQLFDALQELKAEGKPIEKPKPLDLASAVPS